MRRFGLYAPVFEIPPFHCAKYAIMSAEELSGAIYQKSDAWNLSKKNKLIKELDKGEDLKNSIEILESGKSLVLFYNPKSQYNEPQRIGTHVALFLENFNEPVFAEQFGEVQRISTLSELKFEGLRPVQIIHPRIYKS